MRTFPLPFRPVRFLLAATACALLLPSLAYAMTGYRIRSVAAQKMIDIPSASTSNGTQLQVWTANGYPQQEWLLVPIEGFPGEYKILSPLSDKVLEVSAASTADNAAVIQWTYGGSSHQKWTIEEDSFGYGMVKILNVNSGKALHVNGTSSGSVLQQLTFNGSVNNQRWMLEPINQALGVTVRMTLTSTGSKSVTVTEALPSDDWLGGIVPASVNNSSTTKIFRVLPGTGFGIEFSGGATTYEVKFEVPTGFKLPKLDQDVMGGNTSTWLELEPTGAEFSGRPGEASPLVMRNGEIELQLGLGQLRNGASAGSVSLRTSALGTYIFGLVVRCPRLDESVEVFRDGSGNIAQIVAPQTVVMVSGNTLAFYPRSSLGSFNGFTGLYDLLSSQYPFVSYLFEGDGGNGKLKITSTTRDIDTSGAPSVRTAITKMERSGYSPTFTWTVKDWTTSGETPLTERVWTWTLDGTNLVETFKVQAAGGSPVAAQSVRVFEEKDWGRDVVSITEGTTNAIKRTFDYYTDSGVVGSYGQVKSIITTPAGSGTVLDWEGFEYDSDHAGVVSKHHKPFNGSPSSLPSPLSSHTSGEVTYFTFEPDAFEQYTRPTLIETKINNVTVSKTVVDYEVDDGIVTAERKEYSDATYYLTTVRKYHQEDASEHRGLPTSITYPDGRKDVFLYALGDLSGNSISFTYSGSAFARVVIHGSSQSSGHDNATTFDTRSIEQVYLVPGQSTAELSIFNANGRLVRTETRAWVGSSWNIIDFVDYSYNGPGRVTARTRPSGAATATTYDGEQIDTETDETGIAISYGYDVGGRRTTATKASATGIGAITTTFTLDAAGRATSEVVSQGSTGETLTSSTAYDTAGRVTSRSVPGPAGAMTTSYTHDPENKKVTTIYPDGARSAEERQLGGRVDNIDKVAIDESTNYPFPLIPQFFSYGVEDGKRWTKTAVVTDSSPPRWTTTWIDWLGRTVKTERTSFTGSGGNYIETHAYNTTTGRLETTTRTGSAPTRYVYDDFNLIRTVLDVNDNGIDLATSDRAAETTRFYESWSSAWWLTEETRAYPTASSGTAYLTSRTRQRLTGFSSNVLSEVQSTDAFGNTATRTVTVNTGTKTVTVTADAPGISNNQTETIVNGLPTGVTGFDGIAFSTGYDALHRPSTSVDPRTGTTTTTYYSGSAAVYRIQDPASNYVATYTYDSAGRVASVTDAASKVAYTSYNSRGQVHRQWGHAVVPVEYAYNDYGEQTTMKTFREGSDWDSSTWAGITTDAADTTTWAYDAPSGLLVSKTDAASKAVTFTYNRQGQLLRRTLARGEYTDYGYDSATGELLTEDNSGSTPDVTYTYKRTGQLNTVTDATGTRTFAYDGTHKLRLNSIALGSFYDSKTLTQQYDGIHRAAGVSISGEFDNDLTFHGTTGLVDTVVATPNGGSARTFTYGYNSGGLVSGYSSGSLSVARAYEAYRDLLTSLDTQWSSTSRTKYEYTYDTRALRATAKQSGDVFYADYGNTPTYYRYAYSDRGELTQGFGYRGTDTSSTSDPLPSRQFAFTYDTAGNRTQTNRVAAADSTIHAAAANDYVTNGLNQYTQRENNRLSVSGLVSSSLTVAIEGSARVAPKSGPFWADEVLVMNSFKPWSGELQVYAKDGSNVRREERVGFLPALEQVYTYDADGNLTGDGVWTYTYDAQNRLIQMATNPAAAGPDYPSRTLTFKYDYLGRRVEKVVAGGPSAGTTRYLYDGWNLLAEYSVSGSLTLQRSYTWGLDLAGSLDATGGVGALLQIRQHSGTAATYLPTYDGNGNVAALLNASDGSVAASYEYSPFGELLRKEGAYAASNPFRFSTKYTDDETNLSYYGMRYYSASLGRFINRDPIEEAGGMNLYGFCGNDPVGSVDVLGLTPPPWSPLYQSHFNEIWEMLDAHGGLWSDGRQMVPSPATDEIFNFMHENMLDPWNFDWAQFEEVVALFQDSQPRGPQSDPVSGGIFASVAADSGKASAGAAAVNIVAASPNEKKTLDLNFGGGALGTFAALNPGTPVSVGGRTFNFSLEPPAGSWSPRGGSTSNLFMSDPLRPSIGLRLDYGYNVATGSTNWHWNQKGVSSVFNITNHATTGAAGAGRLVNVLKVGGRVAIVGGVVVSAAEIVNSDRPGYEVGRQATGWAGATAGGAIGAKVFPLFLSS